MTIFGIVSIIFALVGAVIYFGIVYVAGRKGWWWLVLLVSLPAILALISYSRMPSDFMAQSTSILLRHFGTVGIVQLVAGIAVYLFGRSRRTSKTSV
ncbi:hypothetical protein [Sphingomonas sp.]|uniref:hypothetical protein n=1 Tax=Sphingomonas sp. TaxID=28214 RepID=UPI0025D0C49E|nr:hypothetical protein [Sphingomonas sp.]